MVKSIISMSIDANLHFQNVLFKKNPWIVNKRRIVFGNDFNTSNGSFNTASSILFSFSRNLYQSALERTRIRE